MTVQIVTLAQTTTLISYDAGGNRIKKQVVGSSPHPTVTASPEAVNPGQTCTLAATGCSGTVQWSPGNQTGSQIMVSPTATTQFTATCSTAGCTNTGFAKTTVTVIQCPSAQLTAATLPEMAVKNGQSVTLYAFGCNNGIINWSSGQTGSPINLKVYGPSTVYTATCTTTYCPNLGAAQVIVGGLSGCLTGDVLMSIKQGNWKDPTVWSCGRIPTSTDEVYLRHPITIDGIAGFIGYARTVIRGEGFLIYDTDGKIILPQ